MKETLRGQIRRLSEEVARLEKARDLAATSHDLEVKRLTTEIISEQGLRVAAQNGLTPYVYAIQALNHWLASRPDLRDQLAPIMRELGLWGVRVGYDPKKDVALTVISPQRH